MASSDVLRDIIAHSGPVSVADYMDLCLAHPEHGYYNTRDPLGQAGDFITSPEVTQVFGELVGVWCAHMWQVMGKPERFDLIELGPGRGTLMNDAMRAAGKLPGFGDAAQIRLVEMSPPLRQLQQQAMERSGHAATWHRALGDINGEACVIIANEFFDALPFHQYIMSRQGWRERLIELNDNRLTWAVSDDQPPPATIPAALENSAEGSIFERAPLREQMAGEIAHRLVTHSGAALIVDYGFSGPALGDSFQALHAHEFVDPLMSPGEADLTSHVDFTALGEAARGANCPAYGPVTQAQLLDGLGIALRMDALKRARPDKAGDLALANARLVSPDQMGALFKGIAFSSVGTPPPFGAD